MKKTCYYKNGPHLTERIRQSQSRKDDLAEKNISYGPAGG